MADRRVGNVPWGNFAPAARRSATHGELRSDMTSRTKLTLDSEPSRRVVIFALWRIASSDVVGTRKLSDDLYDKAWAGIHPAYVPGDDLGEAEHCLVRLGAIQSAARTLAKAELGERLVLPVSPREFDDALRDFLIAIEQSDELLAELRVPEQEDIARCRAAAAQLLWEVDKLMLPATLRPPEFAEPPLVYRQDRTRDLPLQAKSS